MRKEGDHKSAKSVVIFWLPLVVGSGGLEASSPSDNRCGLPADFLMGELFLALISTDVGKPASRDAWSVRMWMRRGLTDDRSVDRTDNRVLPRFACTSLTCAGKNLR